MNQFPFLLSLFLCTTAHALEPWADQKLPVKEGLALWLDAAGEAKAMRLEGKEVSNKTVPLDLWHDASGHGRHARQSVGDAQPWWALAYPARTMQFDGKQRHWLVESPQWSVRQATVIVVARVKENPGDFSALLSSGEGGASDYRSGVNLDFGGKTSENISALNLEGRGFTGEGVMPVRRRLISDRSLPRPF